MLTLEFERGFELLLDTLRSFLYSSANQAEQPQQREGPEDFPALSIATFCCLFPRRRWSRPELRLRVSPQLLAISSGQTRLYGHRPAGRAHSINMLHELALEMATKLGRTDGMTASPTDAIATLRIEIKYIEPLIWRRVAVRTSTNLKALHTVIQATVGWLDYHQWEFLINERNYGIPDPDRPHVKNGATTRLAASLASGITEFGYVYDFGDNWEHRIVVEEVGTAEAGAKYPRFLGGELPVGIFVGTSPTHICPND
jgi:hypothetical protein